MRLYPRTPKSTRNPSRRCCPSKRAMMNLNSGLVSSYWASMQLMLMVVMMMMMIKAEFVVVETRQ